MSLWVMIIKKLSMIDVVLRKNFWDNNKVWGIIHLNSLILKIFLGRCSLKWPKEGEEDCHLNLLIYSVALDNLVEEEQEGVIIFLKICLMVPWEEELPLHFQLVDQEVLEYFTLQVEVEADNDNKIMKILTKVMGIIINDKELILQFKSNLLMKLLMEYVLVVLKWYSGCYSLVKFFLVLFHNC